MSNHKIENVVKTPKKAKATEVNLEDDQED
jgi:hypothetical protein